jgi:prepilin-type N-terminal cleavage/methylation domain-containing protein
MSKDCLTKSQGFSLLEVLIALMLLASAVLAAGQLIYSAAGSGSLARSKFTATVAAQDKLEQLSALYAQNPLANDLAIGDHGPQQSGTINPLDGTVLNNFNIYWNMSEITDPRPGIKINARQARVTVIPIRIGGTENRQPFLNKIISVCSVFSPKMP